ncbi:transposase [Streptomyces olivochromogenes]|nr:transposase [Streptomyces olivochromogenes]
MTAPTVPDRAAGAGGRRVRLPEGLHLRHRTGRRRGWPGRGRTARRTSETFSAWLTEHPGAEIICRDRATAYARAIRKAAPHALEVADRWHLLQNLSAAVEKTCHQHRDCLRKRVQEDDAVAARGTAPHPDHRTHPPPLRRHPPPAGETLDDQRRRPPSEPRPQHRAPLPRHRPRRTAGLRPRPPPQRRPGAVQGGRSPTVLRLV